MGDGRYAPSTDVLERVETRTGVGPRYAQQMLADLTAGWVRHLPLVDGDGNVGSISGDVGADTQYTRVRLTPVGELALASESGPLGRCPWTSSKAPCTGGRSAAVRPRVDRPGAARRR